MAAEEALENVQSQQMDDLESRNRLPYIPTFESATKGSAAILGDVIRRQRYQTRCDLEDGHSMKDILQAPPRIVEAFSNESQGVKRWWVGDGG